MTTTPNQIIFITGLSGAGLSSVLKSLEDMGFETFDNFPLSLTDPLIKKSTGKPIALGIDSRSRDFNPTQIIEAAQSLNAKLIFITCDTDVLQNRFKDTRRRHPMAENKPIAQGIKKERELFKDIQDHADITIDTTELSVHDLRHILERHFKPQGKDSLTVDLISFGFRYGTPREADIIWDVRFLKNPHWMKGLKPKTGQDKDVQDYIQTDPVHDEFLGKLKDLLDLTIPMYAKEGKNYLTIALGCTGGRHRSVYMVETLSSYLKEKNINVSLEHRDLQA